LQRIIEGKIAFCKGGSTSPSADRRVPPEVLNLSTKGLMTGSSKKEGRGSGEKGKEIDPSLLSGREEEVTGSILT